MKTIYIQKNIIMIKIIIFKNEHWLVLFDCNLIIVTYYATDFLFVYKCQERFLKKNKSIIKQELIVQAIIMLFEL